MITGGSHSAALGRIGLLLLLSAILGSPLQASMQVHWYATNGAWAEITQDSIMSIDTNATPPAFQVDIAPPCSSCSTTVSAAISFQTNFNKYNGWNYYTYWVQKSTITGAGSAIFQANGYAGDVYINYVTTDSNGQEVESGTLHCGILGRNPPPSQVDSNMLNIAWFFQKMLNQESGYRQFVLNTTDVIGSSVGAPLFNAANKQGLYPHDSDGGVGIGQLTPGNTNFDIFNWTNNLRDSQTLLINNQAQAYSHWTSAVNSMYSDPNGYLPNNSYFPGPAPACSFGFYTSPGTYSFADANWMMSYNTGPGAAYFINWNPTANGVPGNWYENATGYGYVGRVCATPPL